ncbi:glycoside hydrolase family 3 N-terminal domain-containing protein [Isoptericola sp. b441]|uniref:beta-N-acetylhexosaminidase n=1 Tax=Actinotalea lenta TaxID=3064654 RepID=A0ABT9DBP0_9CELL|nr:glycoside hydrolase family 3 N-terminal domain-containing protein [Isoptericola sp. b441]MDO8108010.1 glycoside hydrolase family 3 N-terminal domain-containing protein [Isoptericola sp. b441]
MPRLVDLTATPYRLTQTQVAWVEDTLAGLSVEEKVGQLFFNLFHFGGDTFSGNDLSNAEILSRYHIGGARYHGGDSTQVQGLLNDLQQHSQIPLLIAANCESGGNGACSDGTYIATGAQCDAAKDDSVPFHTGLVSAREAGALGVNVNFAPIVDILQNWRNTIVNTRAHGTTAEDVIRSTSAKVRGLRAESDMVVCIKHFPGDGTEERDQHLVLGVNELSPQEWDTSFGRVYQHHIDAGIDMIMAGHIALPAYSKQLDPSLRDEDIMPATLAPELLQDLLKDRLGFNGVVVTDATHMLGMSSAMRRQDYVPQAIAAGCDMFLFFNDMAEDFGFMLDGVRHGVITPERLDDAVRRILGLKARLDLVGKRERGELLKSAEDLAVIGCEEHLRWRAEAADAAITLVKDTLHQLPIRPETHRRIRLYFLDQAAEAIYAAGEGVLGNLVAELEGRGFEVTVNDGTSRVKGKTLDYRDSVDAALVVADIVGYAAENNYRIRWKTPMSTDAPWYVHEVPTVMVSLNYTTHLHDATMVKTYINAYHDNPETIRQVVDKLTGESEFTGTANDLVWTEKWQARL